MDPAQQIALLHDLQHLKSHIDGRARNGEDWPALAIRGTGNGGLLLCMHLAHGDDAEAQTERLLSVADELGLPLQEDQYGVEFEREIGPQTAGWTDALAASAERAYGKSDAAEACVATVRAELLPRLEASYRNEYVEDAAFERAACRLLQSLQEYRPAEHGDLTAYLSQAVERVVVERSRQQAAREQAEPEKAQAFDRLLRTACRTKGHAERARHAVQTPEYVKGILRECTETLALNRGMRLEAAKRRARDHMADSLEHFMQVCAAEGVLPNTPGHPRSNLRMHAEHFLVDEKADAHGHGRNLLRARLRMEPITALVAQPELHSRQSRAGLSAGRS